MRIALIDLGTNAVRFDVHEVPLKGESRRLHRERLAVRLGEGVFVLGRLKRSAMRRTLAAFDSFKKTCRALGVERITAFGTSALRDSANSDDLLRLIKQRTGIEVRVISGQEEAHLIAQGVMAHEKKEPRGLTALVDIGGGSVEISICRGRTLRRSTSFKLGVARLQQVFLKSVPPRAIPGDLSPLKKLRRHIRSLLAEGAPRGGWPRVVKIFGSAGTIRALDRIHRESGGERLNAKQLGRWVDRMGPLSKIQLARIPGMDLKRLDTILAGAVVLEEIVRALDAEAVVPTEFSLKDGMLEDEIRTVRRGVGTALDFHLNDIFKRARQWGMDPRHLRHVDVFSRTLFDRLIPLHRLDLPWRDYLVAAAWLQDVGETISPVHHERHSYYMVKNGDFPGVEPWEMELIGQLVLWHKGGKMEREAIPFPDVQRQRSFFKLLAILRIVDALEKPQAHRVTLQDVQRRRRRVHLLLSGDRSAVDLAVLRVEQKKALFENIFKTVLSASKA